MPDIARQDQEQVAAVANRLWRERGCIEGHAEEDWHRAEELLCSQKGAASSEPPKVAHSLAFGIDFGSSNSCVAAAGDGGAQPLRIGNNEFDEMVPSCLYIAEDGQKLFGRDALEYKYLNPSRFLDGLKERILKDSPAFIREGDESYPAEWLAPHELAGLYLGEMLRRAERVVGGSAEVAVLAIPATYTDREKKVMYDAAELAGLRDVEFVYEPVAAAIHYADSGDLNLQPGQLALVYDFGGGTFDATLIERKGEGYLFPAAPDGLADCGGDDMDLALFEALIARAPETMRSWMRSASDRAALQQQVELLDKCRQMKHGFSNAALPRLEIALPAGWPEQFFSLERQAFNDLVAPFIQRTLVCCDRLLARAGKSSDDLKAVLAVGGTSRMPLVTEMLKQKFGNRIVMKSQPQLAVSLGAARKGVKSRKKPAEAEGDPNGSPAEQLQFFRTRMQALSNSFEKLIKDHPHEFHAEQIRALVADLRRRFAEARARLARPVFRISMISTTSAGKSTLVNAFAGSEIAPMSDREMSAGVLVLRDADDLTLDVKDTPGRVWKLDYRQTRDEPFTVEGIYNFLREGVMFPYHHALSGERPADPPPGMPEIVVGAPLLIARARRLLEIPEGVALEICDLPGLNTTQQNDRHLKIIQSQVKGSFCLMALDYTQTDKERREKLLTELADVVKSCGGDADSIIFILNKFDVRGPADSKDEVEKCVQDMRTEIQRRLKMRQEPELIPTNARLWAYAQMAWGPSDPEGEPTASTEVRKLRLDQVAEYCANNLQALAKTAAEFRSWCAGKLGFGGWDHPLNNEHLKEFLLSFVYPSTGADYLFREIRTRLRDRFRALVIRPAIWDAVAGTEAFVATLQEIIHSTNQLKNKSLQQVISELEKKARSVHRTLEDEVQKFTDVLHVAQEAFKAIPASGPDRGKEQKKKESHLKAAIKGLEDVGAPREFYDILTNTESNVRKDLDDAICQPLQVSEWEVEDEASIAKKLSEQGLPLRRARAIAAAYSSYLGAIAGLDRANNYAEVRLPAGSKPDKVSKIENRYGPLITLIEDACIDRTEYFLRQQASSIEKELEKFLEVLQNKLTTIASKEAGIDAVLKGRRIEDRPKRFELPDDLFAFDPTAKRGPDESETVWEDKQREKKRKWFNPFRLIKGDTYMETYREQNTRTIHVYRFPGPVKFAHEIEKTAKVASQVVGGQLAKWAVAAFEDYSRELSDAGKQISKAVREQLEDRRVRLEEWRVIDSEARSMEGQIHEIRTATGLQSKAAV